MWQVIVTNKSMKERVGASKEPKVIDSTEYNFKNKKEAFTKFATLYKEYFEFSYDWKGHSFGALKFYHGENEIEYLTVILLTYKGREYTTGSKKDFELLDRILDDK